MSKEPLRILMLAANPVDQNRLKLTEEYRLLRSMMFDNSEAGKCDLRVEWAARAYELKKALRETRPHIVHFSGHGADASISLEDDERKSRPLSKRELGLLFNLSRSRIRVVVLNACYSARQVESLAEVVDFIVGTNVPITDHTAMQFTNDFYRAIAVGGTVREAFSKANDAAIDQSGQAGRYELFVRHDADESTPLLPPSTNSKKIIEIDELDTDEMNIATKIFEGVNPASVEQSVSNEQTEMHLKSKKAKTGVFNLADMICKQEK